MWVLQILLRLCYNKIIASKLESLVRRSVHLVSQNVLLYPVVVELLIVFGADKFSYEAPAGIGVMPRSNGHNTSRHIFAPSKKTFSRARLFWM